MHRWKEQVSRQYLNTIKESMHSCRKGLYNSKNFLQYFLVPECSLGLKLSYETCITQWTNVLMQGHCNQNGYFGYVSGNLVSIQKSFYKLTAIPQAWPRIYFKSIFKKLAKLDRVRLTS